MHRLRIRLIMQDSSELEGVALDTTRTDSHQEALLIETDAGAVKVALDQLLSMHSLTANPYFEDVQFAPNV
ncbi:Rho-binding antiterminator [Ningiella sp. W23]|uniref:Rho-binding antiterminator n=1 Tax=Ningiella sp. W23 TaxID=3023715 RepID=UPI0037564D10